MKTYTVKSGDTLSQIAQRHDLTLEELRSANPQVKNVNLIQVGQTINIPDSDAGASPSTSAVPTPPITPTDSDFTPITEKQLRAIVPNLDGAKAATLVEPLNNAMEEASINTPLRQSAFLAQIAHETGGFKWFRELGNDAYFKKYDGRKDLGNTQPGDGPRYKGRGFIQITGRANYEKAGQALGIDLINEPQLAETPTVGARVATWFWGSRNLNSYADKGDFITITRRINGGLNGLEDRQAYYARAKETLGAA